MASLGVDFKTKTLKIEDKLIKFQIWDFSGNDRLNTITRNYYKGAVGIILVYAINDRESFEHVKSWMKQIEEYH